MGLVALLLLFELIGLGLHAELDKKTNGNPLVMLPALVAIAAFLIPLHELLNKWVAEFFSRGRRHGRGLIAFFKEQLKNQFQKTRSSKRRPRDGAPGKKDLPPDSGA